MLPKELTKLVQEFAGPPKIRTVFHRKSREFENAIFKIIGEFVGEDYAGDISYRLSFMSTKRRELSRIFIVKRIRNAVVSRKWLKTWIPCKNPATQTMIRLLEGSMTKESGFDDLGPKHKSFVRQHVNNLKQQVIYDYLLYEI